MIGYTETYHHSTLVGESKNTHNFASKQDIQYVTYYVLVEYNNLLFFVNMLKCVLSGKEINYTLKFM